ncbi:MAG: isocitrate lyase/phosphoenolpyruvate mutase family protein [Erythrobacter sp.]|nr:isocitrate lyase/phosphoenolpyruvate mutase family protein [Erythrobacter sp.]
MTKNEFAALHRSGDPLVLYNVWDAGSAVAVAEAGAKAIATGSHSLAGAQGYDDGEHIPIARLVETARQIADAVDLPITVDMEAGYATNLADLERNADAMMHAGAIGCNLEDRLIRAGGLRSIEEQAERIAAVDGEGLFVNARTDTFLAPLMAGEDPNQIELVHAAIERAAAYRAAGAGCFFIPGLSDPDLIAQVCDAVAMPVNVMRLPEMVGNSELAKLGVARISYGGAPWRTAMAGVTEAARAAFGS